MFCKKKRKKRVQFRTKNGMLNAGSGYSLERYVLRKL